MAMTLKTLALSMTLGLSAALLSACGSDKAETKAVDAAAATAADKLETKFVTVGTGGASGPYNIIGTAMTEPMSKPLA